jgi:hypothetical protein
MSPKTEQLLNEAVNAAIEYAVKDISGRPFASGRALMNQTARKDAMYAAKKALVIHLNELERYAAEGQAAAFEFSTGKMLMGD